MTAFMRAALAVRAAYARNPSLLLLPLELTAALDELAAADPTERENPAARRSDPATSHAGAASVRFRAGSQRHRLLRAYAGTSIGLTADEARRWADLPSTSCFWKRCSELREAGLIVDTGRTSPGDAGDEQMVCAITETGRAVFATLQQS